MTHFLALLWLVNMLHILSDVEGSSERSKPIKRVVPVSDVRIEVIPSTPISTTLKDAKSKILPISQKNSTMKRSSSQLCSSDSFLLHLSIPRSHSSQSSKLSMKENEETKEKFVLSLEPINFQLIHPNAKIIYHSRNSNQTDQSFINSKPIIPDEVLAYSGSVVYSSDTALPQVFNKKTKSSYYDFEDQRDPLVSWASILVHHPYGSNCVDISKNLILEGAFELNGRLWHIKSLESYQKSKSSQDFEPTSQSSSASSNLVAWCNSDDLPSSSGTRNQKNRPTLNGSLNQTTINFSTNLTDQTVSFQETSTQTLGYGLKLQKRQTMASDIAGLSSAKVDYANTIGSKDGCPNTLKMVYIGIAVDCTYLRRYGSIDSVRLNVLNNMNLVSSVYRSQFNISLGIIEILLPPDSTCPAQAQSDRPWNLDCPDSSQGGLELNERLNQFSQWRSDKGASDGAGLWHLMTDCPNGNEVGVSWLGALCKVNAEKGINGGTTSGTGLTSASPNEWQIMAHEIGHNFGAVHDCTAGCSMGDPCCPMTTSSCNSEDRFIMAPTNGGDSTSQFSECSVGNICRSLKSDNQEGMESSCIRELGEHYTISINQCGNGILEPGEDCDPGQVASPCCQWGVCKFTPGSVCMPDNSDSTCCTSNCQFSPASTSCSVNSSPLMPSSSGTCSGDSPKCNIAPAV